MQFAPLYPVIHQLLKPMFPGCLWRTSTQPHRVALTFDDGPHPQYTPQLLQVLDRHNVSASFFWLGWCVERYPAIARELYQQGHWVGLHGYDHRSFPWLTTEQLRQQLEQTQMAIAKACHLEEEYVRQNVRDVRPPNGLFTPPILDALRQWGYRPVMWSVVPEDWVRPGIHVATQRVLDQTCGGDVIVLHDGRCGGEDVAETAAAIIPALRDRGYEFVTIDTLWRQVCSS